LSEEDIMTDAKTVFLDLDGVLCDWAGAVCQLFEVDYETLDWSGGNDIIHALGCSKSELWRRVDAKGIDFWANLEPLPWLDELVGLAREAGNMCVLTSPGHDPASAAGKILWMNEHLGGGKPFRDFLIGPRKRRCAHPGSLLIDDRDKLTDRFNDHGGTGIVFPRPWNSRSEFSDDPMDYVREQLADAGIYTDPADRLYEMACSTLPTRQLELLARSLAQQAAVRSAKESA